MSIVQSSAKHAYTHTVNLLTPIAPKSHPKSRDFLDGPVALISKWQDGSQCFLSSHSERGQSAPLFRIYRQETTP